MKQQRCWVEKTKPHKPSVTSPWNTSFWGSPLLIPLLLGAQRWGNGTEVLGRQSFYDTYLCTHNVTTPEIKGHPLFLLSFLFFPELLLL